MPQVRQSVPGPKRWAQPPRPHFNPGKSGFGVYVIGPHANPTRFSLTLKRPITCRASAGLGINQMRSWGYAPSFSAQVRFGEPGAPVQFLSAPAMTQTPLGTTDRDSNRTGGSTTLA